MIYLSYLEDEICNFYVGSMFRENPPRQVISISPAYNYNMHRPAQSQPYVDPASGYSIFFIY